jgi:autophagy-related protein 9
MLHSSLLDIHNQPLPTRSMRHPMFHPSSAESLREEDEEEVGAVPDGGMRYRSNLGESFVSARVTQTVLNNAEDESGHNAGVLDLLNQFVGGEGAGRTNVI